MASSTTAGASRRSHTKSRKGCNTCKRRHIRCDETFPQCRNCQKHQVRCDYMDRVQASDSDPQSQPPVPELYWSPEIDSVLDSWQRSGYCTLGGYSIDLRASGHNFTKSDLHLIYYALWSGQHNTANEFTVWTGKTPKFLEVATSQPFLVHAILGFGALAVAWEKNSTDAKALAYLHGSIALQGLQEAINSFSQENSDAVLAASILLSWQANDWRSWVSLISGIRTLTRSMRAWRGQSRLTDVLDEQDMAIQPDFPSLSRTRNHEEARQSHASILQNIYVSLDFLVPQLGNSESVPHVEQLKDYIQRLLNIRQAQTPEEEFNQLYAFRKWLFWIPAALLRSQTRDYMTLVALAYFYATALSFESIYPSVASAFCSTIALRPLEEIIRSFDGAHMGLYQLLEWPRQVVAAYKQRKQVMFAQMHPVPHQGFEALSSELAQMYEQKRIGSHPSPAIGPPSSSQVSSSHGSPYLDVPSIAESGPSSFGSHYSHTPVMLPSMTADFEPVDHYGPGSHGDWRGFVNPTALWT